MRPELERQIALIVAELVGDLSVAAVRAFQTMDYHQVETRDTSICQRLLVPRKLVVVVRVIVRELLMDELRPPARKI